MRRRIRLTGRKQLPLSSIEAKIFEESPRILVSLVLKERRTFERFPATSLVKLRLFENKVAETLEFGTIGAPRVIQELKNPTFSAPSCQVRVVATDGMQKGQVLGSSNMWTLRIDAEDRTGKGSEGLLMFQSREIAPRTWSLEIREDDYPIVYVDKSIPQSGVWVRNDPVFVSCVLPAIVREVFEDILMFENQPSDTTWVKHWLEWADDITPGKPPPWNDERGQKQRWINDLIEGFCYRHGMLDALVGSLQKEVGA